MVDRFTIFEGGRGYGHVRDEQRRSIAAYGDARMEPEESAAKAVMICEALNVHHETGLTPKEMLAALRRAIGHIEHMARWISARKAGYSFEGLHEDLLDIWVAIGKAKDPACIAVADRVGRLIDREDLLAKLRRERDEYLAEHFTTDPETGAVESRRAKEEYLSYLDETIEQFPAAHTKPEAAS